MKVKKGQLVWRPSGISTAARKGFRTKVLVGKKNSSKGPRRSKVAKNLKRDRSRHAVDRVKRTIKRKHRDKRVSVVSVEQSQADSRLGSSDAKSSD